MGRARGFDVTVFAQLDDLITGRTRVQHSERKNICGTVVDLLNRSGATLEHFIRRNSNGRLTAFTEAASAAKCVCARSVVTRPQDVFLTIQEIKTQVNRFRNHNASRDDMAAIAAFCGRMRQYQPGN